MNQHKTEINKASKAISSVQNYAPLCANFLATAAEGFKHPILFANEEAQDWVFRTGTSWPGPTFIPPATPGAEQLGVVYAHDVKNGKTKPIYGMGRHQPRERRRDPGLRRHRRALRRRHVPDESAPGVVSAVHVHGRRIRTSSGTTRARCTRSWPMVRHRQRTTTTSISSLATRSRALPPRTRPDREGQGRRRTRADASGRLPELLAAGRRAVVASGRATVGARPVG